MTTLTICTARKEDLTEIINLENSEWNEQQRCTPDNFLQRIYNYQDGFLVGRSNNEIVASFYAIKLIRRDSELINWKRDSGHGTGCTHDDNGNSLFSISITVSRHAPAGTYRSMMNAWRALAKTQCIDYIYAGSRIPGLSQFQGSPEDYISQIKSKKMFDPILSKALNYGFSIGKLIPDYFDDPESLNYGVEIFKII